jgi:hypothetical protein
MLSYGLIILVSLFGNGLVLGIILRSVALRLVFRIFLRSVVLMFVFGVIF